jgi:hypothetical protein
LIIGCAAVAFIVGGPSLTDSLLFLATVVVFLTIYMALRRRGRGSGHL